MKGGDANENCNDSHGYRDRPHSDQPNGYKLCINGITVATAATTAAIKAATDTRV